jgi:phosphoribosylformylglycinamidine cyclo-ligase
MGAGDRPQGLTYAQAGVDLAAADDAVARIAPHAARTARPEVLGGLGGFGGLFALDPARYRSPVLVTATDGVGTKLELARALGRHRTVGLDLVAMVVDDLVVPGAEPLLFLDYLAVERLDPAHVEQVVAGIADGCLLAGCALVGGETAEHPGVLPPGSYDVAGFGVGIVERDALLGPARVRPGDTVVALASTGLHSNGYSLARRIVEGLDLGQAHGGAEPLGEALLRPTRIYAPDCLALAAQGHVHAFCHVTGGGVPGNLPRVLPEGLGAVVDTATFPVPPVLGLLARLGGVAEAEMWRTFNMGAGMLAVVGEAGAADALALLAERGVPAWPCGRVTEGGAVELAGLARPGPARPGLA